MQVRSPRGWANSEASLMISSSPLGAAQQRTYEAIFANASTPDLAWSAVRGLLEQLGPVVADPYGNLSVTRHGRVLELHPAQTKDVGESGELGALRRFLVESESPRSPSFGPDPHLLLVIDGKAARLFRCQVLGGVPQLLLPYEASKPDSDDYLPRKARRAAVETRANGFFAPMLEDLQVAGQIVIFSVGSVTPAAEYVEWLKQNDSEISRRIIGVESIESREQEGPELLRVAREFYASLDGPK